MGRVTSGVKSGGSPRIPRRSVLAAPLATLIELGEGEFVCTTIAAAMTELLTFRVLDVAD